MLAEVPTLPAEALTTPATTVLGCGFGFLA